MERLTISWNGFKKTFNKSKSKIYAIFMEDNVVLVFKISAVAYCLCSIKNAHFDFEEFKTEYIDSIAGKCDSIEDAIAYIEAGI